MLHDRSAVLAIPVAAPFRWAGGKRWLVPMLRELISQGSFRAYHEPFLGGGSVFLGLGPFRRAVLSDSNAELIEAFEGIRDAPEQVAEIAHAHGFDPETYYHLRATVSVDKIERAARFLYLNHMSFNGIYRVNLDGIYNVPFGRRKNVNMPTADQLVDVASRLKGARLVARDFAKCIKDVRAGDLVFLDPPYTVAHNNNGFVKYNQRLFSWDDQQRLSRLIDEIKGIGAYYVLTNAAHDSIGELFEKGDCLLQTRRRNNIGGNNAVRGAATEYLFTNLI